MEVGVLGTGGAGKGAIRNLTTNALISSIVAYETMCLCHAAEESADTGRPVRLGEV